MTAAVDWNGGSMAEQHGPRDDEFERWEQWFNPKHLRKILQEWHARYEPWVYTHPDERALRPLLRKHDIEDVPEIDRALVAGEVHRALMQLAMHDPGLHDIIVGFYLDVEIKQDPERPHVMNMEPRMNVFQLAEWQGCSPRTIYRREEKARYWMAERLGWRRPGG